jgi:hypothetical protein
LKLDDILRTHTHVHRLLPADSDLAAAIAMLARIHQVLVRRRRPRGERDPEPAALVVIG